MPVACQLWELVSASVQLLLDLDELHAHTPCTLFRRKGVDIKLCPSSSLRSLTVASLQTEDKLRRKAFKAAAKENKPLFGEDGKVRGLLEKYDEEEQEAGMEIDATGAVEEAKRKKQEDIRARLRAGMLPFCSEVHICVVLHCVVGGEELIALWSAGMTWVSPQY